MRINRGDMTSNREIELQPSRPSRDAVDSTTSPASEGGAASDSIALSGLNDLAQLALGAGSNERAQRVEQLRQQVQANQYVVEPDRVGRALIAAHMTGG